MVPERKRNIFENAGTTILQQSLEFDLIDVLATY